MIITWILVFLALLITDFCWGIYIAKVQAGDAIKAGLWAVALFIPGAFVTLSYVHNPWLLIPAGLGAFAGTFLSVKWENKKDRPSLKEMLSHFDSDKHGKF